MQYNIFKLKLTEHGAASNLTCQSEGPEQSRMFATLQLVHLPFVICL